MQFADVACALKTQTAVIIANPDKVCVKFSFLTVTLTLLCYDSGRKSERVMELSHVKKAAAQAVLLVVGIG